jgi:hypothetical protein
MSEADTMQQALVTYREALKSKPSSVIDEAKVMDLFPEFIEACFSGGWRWWRHWDLYWPPSSGFSLVGEVKGNASPQFNPYDSREGVGYIHIDALGRVQSNQRGDGVAQLHLYCWELRVPYGLFTNGDRLLIYRHKQPFSAHCFRKTTALCGFRRDKILDVNLLGDDPGPVVENMINARGIIASLSAAAHL